MSAENNYLFVENPKESGEGKKKISQYFLGGSEPKPENF